jgi:hypothetical protein
MRNTKDWEDFPYTSKRVCYMELDNNGLLSQLSGGSDFKAAHGNAVAGKSKIFAVCPGEWSSDLFIVDLNSFADAFGVPRQDSHIHKISWKLSSIDDGKSLYASVDVLFECGCRLSLNNIKKIANDLREQMGWEMATSTGFGGGYSLNGEVPRYTISVRRKSLTQENK